MDEDLLFLQRRGSMRLLVWKLHDRLIICFLIVSRAFAFIVWLNLSFGVPFSPASLIIMCFLLTFEILLHFYVEECKDDNFF
jgi:hypothetical protein